MSRRAGPIIVMCTVLMVHLVFLPATYHASEIKFFVFTAGALALIGVVAGRAFFGRREFAAAFSAPVLMRVLLGVLAYLVLSAASMIWARYRVAAGFRSLETLLYVVWALLVAVILSDRRDLSRLIGLFLLAGLLTAATALALTPLQEEQFVLPMGSANWLAACLLIPMMLCVEGFCQRLFGRPRRVAFAVLFALAFALMGAVLVLSRSESAAAAFILALVALPVLLGGRRRWLTVGAIIGVILLACAADLILGRPGKIRSFAQSKSVHIRLDMWRWSLKLARRNPVSGLGAGGFLPNVGEVSAPDIDRRPGYYADITQHAHNEPLEILVEVGALGLLAFLWPIGILLRGVAAMPRDGPVGELRLRLGAFAAGWLAVFLQSFLTVGMRFWSVPVVFWTGLGLLAASLRILPTPDAPEADAPAASPPASSPAAAVKTCALVLVLLAAGTFFIVRGLRASLAMKQALRTEDLSERTALLRRASAESVFFVDRVRARNMLGRTLHEAGNPAAASDEFKSVLNLAGHYHDVELRLASTYLDRRRPEDAARHIESYGRLRPADTRTAGILVRYLTGLAPEEAVRTLNALVEKHPRCSKIRIAAGKVGLRMSPPDEAAARRHFAKAIEVNPDDPQAAYLVGIEQLKARHYPQARLLLKRSLEGGLRLPELYLNLSRVERMLGEPGRSRQLLEDGLKLFPDAAELKRELEGLV